jgi:hypothetical protein
MIYATSPALEAASLNLIFYIKRPDVSLSYQTYNK